MRNKSVPTDRKFKDLTLDEQIAAAEKLRHDLVDKVAPWAIPLLDLHRMELKILKGMLEEFREGREPVDSKLSKSKHKKENLNTEDDNSEGEIKWQRRSSRM